MRARSRFERATFNYRARVRVKALKLGLAGERAVGQFLEGLRVGGARIMASSQRKFDPERIAGRIVVLRELLASNAARGSVNLDACATFRINNLLLRVQSFPTGTWCQP
jgi:hypothetical protein